MKKLFCSLSLVASLVLGVQSANAEKATTEDLNALPPSEAAAKLFASNDLNKDGKLSKKEVNWYFRVKRFSYVDKNKDGFIDQEELTNSYEKTAQLNAKN
jgi:Ca2+-binding EF-hand superfamily protein